MQNPPFGTRLEAPVLVPFCLESALSGRSESNVKSKLAHQTTGVTGKGPDGGRIYSWYQTALDIPSDWPKDNRILLNFGAVDFEATVFVNKQQATFHRGGYFEFSVDITSYLSSNGTNEL